MDARPWSAEFEFVRLCARTTLTDADIEAIVQLLRRGSISASSVIETANEQGILLLVYKSLSTLGEQFVPASVLKMLKRTFAREYVHKQYVIAEAARIVEGLEAQGIPALILKGAPVAQLAYGTIKWRYFSDVDILIELDDFEATEQWLVQQGYASAFDAWQRGHNKRIYKWLKAEWTYVRGGLVVDLHARAVPRRYAFRWQHEDLLDRAIHVEVEGRRLRTLSPEDMLQHLCYHGMENAWRLKYVVDIAELVRRDEVDWELLLRRAAEVRGEHILALGLALANEILKAPVPDRLQRWVAEQPISWAVQHYLTNIAQAHTNHSHLSFSERTRLQLGMQDTLFTKMRFAAFGAVRQVYEMMRTPTGRSAVIRGRVVEG